MTAGQSESARRNCAGSPPGARGLCQCGMCRSGQIQVPLDGVVRARVTDTQGDRALVTRSPWLPKGGNARGTLKRASQLGWLRRSRCRSIETIILKSRHASTRSVSPCIFPPIHPPVPNGAKVCKQRARRSKTHAHNWQLLSAGAGRRNRLVSAGAISEHRSGAAGGSGASTVLCLQLGYESACFCCCAAATQMLRGRRVKANGQSTTIGSEGRCRLAARTATLAGSGQAGYGGKYE